MAKVFLVQRPAAKVNGSWTDKYDLSPAEHFGELVACLPPGNIPRDLSATIAKLQAALSDFSDADYLLAIGDPVAIGIATVIAHRANSGRVTLLKWDRRATHYIPYHLDL